MALAPFYVWLLDVEGVGVGGVPDDDKSHRSTHTEEFHLSTFGGIDGITTIGLPQFISGRP
jgi:hypothetical protein